jgi:hypothetical protein
MKMMIAAALMFVSASAQADTLFANCMFKDWQMVKAAVSFADVKADASVLRDLKKTLKLERGPVCEQAFSSEPELLPSIEEHYVYHISHLSRVFVVDISWDKIQKEFVNVSVTE